MAWLVPTVTNSSQMNKWTHMRGGLVRLASVRRTAWIQKKYTYLLRISCKFTYKSSTERSMSGLQERTEITSLDTLFVISTNSWSLTNFWAKTTWGSQLDFPSETITGLVNLVSREFLYKIVVKLHLFTRWASSQCLDVFCLFQFQIRLYC